MKKNLIKILSSLIVKIQAKNYLSLPIYSQGNLKKTLIQEGTGILCRKGFEIPILAC